MFLNRLLRPKGEDETFLQENVNWALLRGFGASKLAAGTTFIPFIGYAILYNKEFRSLLGGLGGLLEAQPEAAQCASFLTFFDKLNLAYIGLFTIGVSAIIFKITAPRELKLYRDTNEFIDREKANLTARKARSMYRTIEYRRPRIASELKSKASWLSSDVSIAKASTEFAGSKNDDVLLDLMRCFFQAQDRHYRRMSAVICAILFLLGSFILAIPSADFTLRVLCVIFT